MDSARKKTKVSMQDVAKAAGVSQATVSRIINNVTIANVETAKRVKAVMEELGYIPPPVKSRSGPRKRIRKKRRQRRIALVCDCDTSKLNYLVYSMMMQGLHNELQENYYDLSILNLNKIGALKESPQKVDGIILFGAHDLDSATLRYMKGIPCVQIMGCISENSFDHVSYNDDNIAKIAYDYFISRGCRKVGIIGGKNSSPENRKEVFLKTASDTGIMEVLDLTCPNLIVHEGEKQYVDSKKVTAICDELSKMNSKLDGIFFLNDIVMYSFFHVIQHFGFKPYENLDLLGVNNISMLLDNLHPRPASVDIHAEKIGHAAFKQLLWRIDNPREPRRIIHLEPELVFGKIP